MELQNMNKSTEIKRSIADYVLKYIKQNKLKDDAVLPSENILARQFKVNRNVVRTALAHLRSQGYIYSIKGKGFFVAKRVKPLIYKHSATIGFSEIVGRQFTDYENTLIACSKSKAKPSECIRLNMTAEENVYRLKTLRSVKGVNFAVCYSSIPEKHVYHLEQYLDDYRSINDIFVNHYGYDQPTCDSITIEAVNPNAELLKYFDMPDGVPILSIGCMFSTEATGPLEHFVIKARSDLFKFTMDFNS